MKTNPRPQQSFMSEQLEAWVLEDFPELPLPRNVLTDQSLETFRGRSVPSALDQELFEYLFEL